MFTWQERAHCQQILHHRSDFWEQTGSACSYRNILSPFVLDFVIKDIWQRGHARKNKNKKQPRHTSRKLKGSKKCLIRPSLPIQNLKCERSYHFYTATWTCEMLLNFICSLSLLHIPSKFMKLIILNGCKWALVNLSLSITHGFIFPTDVGFFFHAKKNNLLIQYKYFPMKKMTKTNLGTKETSSPSK